MMPDNSKRSPSCTFKGLHSIAGIDYNGPAFEHGGRGRSPGPSYPRAPSAYSSHSSAGHCPTVTASAPANISRLRAVLPIFRTWPTRCDITPSTPAALGPPVSTVASLVRAVTHPAGGAVFLNYDSRVVRFAAALDIAGNYGSCALVSAPCCGVGGESRKAHGKKDGRPVGRWRPALSLLIVQS